MIEQQPEQVNQEEKAASPLEQLVSEDAIKEIELWRRKYPSERKRPPIIAALKVIQAEHENYLTEELMIALANYLDVPAIAVFEVATFYTMFNLKPVGKHVISVCTNLSCMMCGSKKIVEHLEKRLKIRLGDTTQDQLITLQEVECLAACGGAPMLEVDQTYFENLNTDKVDDILKHLGWEDSAK
ncbi:NADH-quinone oxidoreductase subunit NuoE family protein [Pleionea litopenaei]|uniref:NADH-quinone oxidoreductase subunit E n=1 Tax=Pleionea litopenaei TaxID=3070815 RepID=A0AA51X6X2_9GAMM|nr:NAD(P)H-dependent oxidoreductase subunit E [Pleionea sp. HL-JVS1]WMS86515.1 NAD(P)H-dependent oxidoreductase subunit E [Pleionea sp. HL-JVS1]